MALNIIVFGASGMVGEGVLIECLAHPEVQRVLVIGRRSCGHTHPKLTEIIHPNFFDLTPLESRLKGFDGAFFCLGVSSVGMKEEEYRRTTYDLTMAVATTLARLNPQMTFTYVSGTGTDSTEQGRLMWARVKGKTENDLMKLPFTASFMFRPGLMKPNVGQQNIKGPLKLAHVLYPIFRVVAPRSVCTLADVGRAMINVTRWGSDKRILDNADITRRATTMG